MPPYAGPPVPRYGDAAGTLRLLGWLALAIALIVLDHRGGWLSKARAQATLAVQPLWRVAALPSELGAELRSRVATRAQLQRENETLRNALLVSGARIARLQTAAGDNVRLTGMLGAVRREGFDVQLVPILDVDLDPTHQRLVLDAGSRDGVRMGQSAVDAGGLLGQVVAVTPGTSTLLLLTDPDHAVPVLVQRNGIRLVAYGTGRSDRIELANVPISGDVRVGDRIVTSGLGGRFPPGFPVGTVSELRPDESRAFLVGELKPAAQLDRGRDVLLLRKVIAAPPKIVAPTTTQPATPPAVPAPASNSPSATPAAPTGAKP
ncbi:rod shape-determining protein MreC [Pseudoluteimonas lycopersici]|uniref:Cell shape-determining protein MreC n=1 Tax=Pseudoluteimonas lycopersici TaxID=1324796 RepID=A0A516V6Y0_9GAMM|nr:rod shape-determining protein MreC [Lysobacter lycopersici]QDQ74294.1 rod shape-determining protein MreC [Lysobacter lycopersici]